MIKIGCILSASKGLVIESYGVEFTNFLWRGKVETEIRFGWR